MLAKFNIRGLKAVLALMVFFATISPVYASAIIPALKNPALKNIASQPEPINKAQAMPCHSDKSHLKKSLITTSHKAPQLTSFKKTQQELCFQHCIQYLDKAWALPKIKKQSAIKPAPFKDKFKWLTDLRATATPVEVSSLSDPPVSNNRDLSQVHNSLLQTTSRLRH